MTQFSIRPTIVVMAHNRPNSLTRLLKSLSAAHCPRGTHLLFTIDHGGAPSVTQLAHDFVWPAGDKTVQVAEEHLGIAAHTFLACDLAAEEGAFILLDDDLYVSPYFDKFALAALTEYAADPKLAGISLQSHRFNETAHQRFAPIDDGTSVFFVQLMSWGHVWVANQWQDFRSWYGRVCKDGVNGANGANALNGVAVPKDVRSWPDTSWKKHFISYMVERDLYCAIPRLSYVTNFADPGVHIMHNLNHFQVELAASARRLDLSPLSKSRAIYDAWCEIVPELLSDVLEPLVRTTDVCVDLYGTKCPGEQSAPYMLTTQPARESIARFGLKLRPREANVLHGITGNEIVLAPTEAVTPHRWNFALPFYEYLFEYDHLRFRDIASILGRKLLLRLGRSIGRNLST